MTKMMLVLMITSGCSLALMENVQRNYSPKDGAPRCTNSAALPITDGLLASSSILGGLLYYSASEPLDDLSGDTSGAREKYLIAEVVLGAVYLVSAISGAGAISDCNRARGEYAAAREGGERDRSADIKAAAEMAEASLVAPKPAVPADNPRGYFCATSPSGGLCTRQKADCARARDAAVGAVPDLAECALVETAWCFDAAGIERCWPSTDGCAVGRERAGAANECVERR